MVGVVFLGHPILCGFVFASGIDPGFSPDIEANPQNELQPLGHAFFHAGTMPAERKHVPGAEARMVVNLECPG